MEKSNESNVGSRWNAANLVTLSRIVVAPLFLIFIFRDELWAKWTAGLLFAWGAVSDYIDGYLARKYNMSSNFGALLDPLADKILLLTVFVSFVQIDLVPVWMVVVIAAREFLITGLRQIAQTHNLVIAASRAGKHKTISQIVAISFILAIICAQATVEAYQGRWDVFIARMGSMGEWINNFVWYAPYWLMFYATVMSTVSGIDYFFKNRFVLTGEYPEKR